jgi:hypothetical protein
MYLEGITYTQGNVAAYSSRFDGFYTWWESDLIFPVTYPVTYPAGKAFMFCASYLEYNTYNVPCKTFYADSFGWPVAVDHGISGEPADNAINIEYGTANRAPGYTNDFVSKYGTANEFRTKARQAAAVIFVKPTFNITYFKQTSGNNTTVTSPWDATYQNTIRLVALAVKGNQAITPSANVTYLTQILTDDGLAKLWIGYVDTADMNKDVTLSWPSSNYYSLVTVGLAISPAGQQIMIFS